MIDPSGAHKSSEYRPDIDGLRAIAVLSVLVYHAFPQALSGGFVGVDVFFVISGYLISRIILGDLKKGNFRFRNFYGRRIRRIFPALILVLSSVVVCGWYVLLPADFQQLGNHVVASAGFVSNILLFVEGGYFDTAADLKPLLHIWSLGVEEQYYLIWPLILYAFRDHLRRILWMIVAIAIGSFLLNVWATPRYADAAFYLPPTRFWELMLGSIVAYVNIARSAAGRNASATTRWSEPLSYVGIMLLVAAFLVIDDDRSFPGWWALLPTLGTLMLICAGPNAHINRRFLSSRVLVYIGLISYPLYLWHWPLLTYARILNADGEPPASIRVIALVLSIILAWFTYEFVEKKIRFVRRTPWAHQVVPTLALSMSVIGACGILALANLTPSRSSSIPYLAAVSHALGDWEGHNGSGEIAGHSKRTVLFFGDSHMAQYIPRIEKLVDDKVSPARTVVYRIRYGCAPVPGVNRRGRRCSEFTQGGFEIAQDDDVDTIVISASWLGFAARPDLYAIGDKNEQLLDPLARSNQWIWDGFEEQLQLLADMGKHIVIMLNGPVGEAFNPRAMVMRQGLDVELKLSSAVPRAHIAEMTAPVDARLRNIAARIQATIVDPADYLCSELECPTTDGDGKPIFMDASHLRASFVRRAFSALDGYVYLEAGPGSAVHD